MQSTYTTTMPFEEVSSFMDQVKKQKFIEILGKKYSLSGYSTALQYYDSMEVSLGLYPYKEPPKPKSEAELQLEQTIKLTQMDISHKERLIEQYEAKRVALEKKRLGGV